MGIASLGACRRHVSRSTRRPRTVAVPNRSWTIRAPLESLPRQRARQSDPVGRIDHWSRSLPAGLGAEQRTRRTAPPTIQASPSGASRTGEGGREADRSAVSGRAQVTKYTHGPGCCAPTPLEAVLARALLRAVALLLLGAAGIAVATLEGAGRRVEPGGRVQGSKSLTEHGSGPPSGAQEQPHLDDYFAYGPHYGKTTNQRTRFFPMKTSLRAAVHVHVGRSLRQDPARVPARLRRPAPALPARRTTAPLYAISLGRRARSAGSASSATSPPPPPPYANGDVFVDDPRALFPRQEKKRPAASSPSTPPPGPGGEVVAGKLASRSSPRRWSPAGRSTSAPRMAPCTGWKATAARCGGSTRRAAPSRAGSRCPRAGWSSATTRAFTPSARSDGTELWTGDDRGARFGLCAGHFYSTPAVAYGRVYAGNIDGYVYSFSARTGKLAWRTKTGGFVYASPSVGQAPGDKPTVYVGSYGGNFYALDAPAAGAVVARRRGKITGGSTVLGDIVSSPISATGARTASAPAPVARCSSSRAAATTR